MPRIYEIISQPDELLALEPEELAGVILQYLDSLPPNNQGALNRHNFGQLHTVQEFPSERQEEVLCALMEGWVWLEREGMLAPRPGADSWVFITRRGKQLVRREDLAAYRRASRLPKELLHSRIAQKVWPNFLRGDYDTAVFQAFKEVEINVRTAGEFSDTDIGVPLMRQAFAPNKGPLADHNAVQAEQEALSHLFAGAIGSYKNPSSHRHMAIDADQSVEMIMLASHLMYIVDERAGTRDA